MRELLLSQFPSLTDYQFNQSADQYRPSIPEGLALGARGLLEDSLLGTVIREAQAPNAANRIGPYGIEADQSRASEIITEDDYKKTPFYPDIPYEPGMTRDRAAALYTAHQEKRVREYFASKRPVAAAIGGLGGAALAPENYIPILGEWAAAATTARFGKVAGRMLTTGADAAINSAAFQLLTARERRSFGDDVTWQSIMENAAFSAMAGAAIGGVAGALSRTRERYRAPEPEARVETPLRREITVPEAPALIEPNAPLPDRGFRLDVPERPTARFIPETRFDVNAALDLIETPAMRAKGAAVMNDAVTGFVTDGEVRLGDYSRQLISDLRSEVNVALSRSEPLPGAPEPRAAEAPIAAAPEAFPPQPRQQTNEAPAQSPPPVAEQAGAPSPRQSLPMLTEHSFTVPPPEQPLPGLQEAYSGFDKLPKAPRTETRNAIRAKAEPRAASSEGALAQPDARPRLVKPVYDAEGQRMAAAAKQQGIDPETGATDLDSDIAILKELGPLKDEAEKILDAADQTFEGAQAWGDTLKSFVACKAVSE